MAAAAGIDLLIWFPAEQLLFPPAETGLEGRRQRRSGPLRPSHQIIPGTVKKGPSEPRPPADGAPDRFQDSFFKTQFSFS